MFWSGCDARANQPLIDTANAIKTNLGC